MVAAPLTLHPILTAETHNFPSGVAPFPGAETGTGGRLRDVQATGRGAHTVAGIRYCMQPLPNGVDHADAVLFCIVNTSPSAHTCPPYR